MYWAITASSNLYGADAIAASPETTTIPWALCLGYFPMNQNRTFAFKKTYPHRNTIPRWHTQKHMDIIRHAFAFQQLNILLTTQFSQNRIYFPTKPSIQRLFTVLWYHYNMIFTIPFYMGLPLTVFHNSSPVPHAKPSSGEPLPKIRRKRLSLWDTHRHSRWFT